MICFFAFFFAVSKNLVTFAAIKGSRWRSPPVLYYLVWLLSKGRSHFR